MNKFKFSILSVIVLAIAAVVVFVALYKIHNSVPVVITVVPDSGQQAATSTKPSATAVSGSATPLTLNLPIPFTSQAPTANWDEAHNEDCEEAVSVMANAYLTGDKDLVIPAARVESEMANLNDWEDAHLGYHLDTTAAETAQMMQSVYGLKTQIVENYTLDQIKAQLNMHHVVILPEDGRLLGNPNYKQPGPIYHMLVIRGYSDASVGAPAPNGASEYVTTLITNDSGTRNGQNYSYTFAALYNAGADWDHSTNTVDQNKKLMIEVWK